jgi:hypothetical protein
MEVDHETIAYYGHLRLPSRHVPVFVELGPRLIGTSQQYYDQAVDLASTGVEADASSGGDWLPLGVFALTKPDQTKSVVSIQLAVNKQGTIRGNYTDTATDN